MSDAVKVGFVPFSAAPRGVLVVFCDDALKFGAATPEGAGEGGRYRQAGGGRQPVQGQERIDARYSGAGGNQGGAPDRGRRRQAGRYQGEGFSQVRRRDGRQAQRRQRCGHRDRRTARRRDAAAMRRPPSRRASGCAPINSTATRPRRRTARTARCAPTFRSPSTMSPPRERRFAPDIPCRRRRDHRARTRQRAAERALSRGIRPPRQPAQEARRRCRGARRQGDDEARHGRVARRRAGLDAAGPHRDHALERRQEGRCNPLLSLAKAFASIPAVFPSRVPPAWRT